MPSKLPSITRLFMIIGYVFLTSCGYLDSEQAKLNKANKLFNENKFNQSIVRTKQILQSDSSSCKARVLLGKSLFAKFSLEDAQIAFHKAREMDCPDTIIFDDLIKILLYRNRLTEAETLISSPMFSYFEKIPNKFKLEGDVYFLTGNFDKAKAAYHKFYEESGNLASDCLNQAKLSMLLNHKQNVVHQTQACETKYRHIPGFDLDESRYLRAIAYLNIPKTKMAENTLKQLISEYSNPKNPYIKIQAALLLMKIYFSDDRLPQAENMADLVLNFVATPEIYYIKGFAEKNNNHLDQAEKAFLSALQLKPDDQPTLLAMTDLKYQQGNIEQAKYYANRVDGLRGGRVAINELADSLALKYYRKGEIDAIINMLPHNGGIKSQYILALAYAKKGRTKAALKTYSDLSLKIDDPIKVDLLKAQLELALNNKFQAISIFKNYAEKGNIYALSSLAKIYISTQEYSKAKSLLKRVINENKNNVAANLLLAEVYAASNNKKELLTFLKNLENADPDNLQYKLVLAKVLFKYAEYYGAIEQSKKIINSEPKNEQAYVVAANSYLRLGRTNDAIDIINNLLLHDNNNVRAYLMLSNLALLKTDNLSALKYVNKALELDSNNLTAISLKIKILVKLDRKSQALEFSKTKAEIFKNNLKKNLLLGFAELEIGNESEAYKYYRKAIDLGSNDINVAFTVYRLSLKLNDATEAEDEFEKFLSKNSEPANLYFAANSYMARGDYTHAKKYYTKLIKKDPRNSVAYNNLALLMLRDGNKQLALNYANRAVKYAPQSPAIMDTMGQVLLANDDIKRAKGFLLGALQQLSDNPSVKLHVAKYYYLVHDYNKSKSLLQDISSIDFSEQQEAIQLLDTINKIAAKAQQ